MYVGYEGIDKAYKIVQTILNENHYGTLTPTRFNVLAHKAQTKVFSEAINFIKNLRFKDLRRRVDQDKVKLYQEAIAPLFVRDKSLTDDTENVFGEEKTIFLKENDIAYVEGALCKNTNGMVRELEIVPINSDVGMTSHPMSPTQAYPIAIDQGDSYEILPETIDNMRLYYYRYPKAPKWTYAAITSDNHPVFNASDSNFQDFEIGVELLDDIILDILQGAGVHLQRQDVVQYSQNEESYSDKQEMQ